MPFASVAAFGLAFAQPAKMQRNPMCEAPAQAARPGIPSGSVRLTFLGNSSILIDDGATQILVDGFFTRPPLTEAALGRLSPDPLLIREGLECAGADRRIKAILVAHAHHDHVLDAPTIARMFDADLVGGRAVGFVAQGQHSGARFVDAGSALPRRYGAFVVEAFNTRHSWPNLVPGDIRKPVHPPPTPARQFKAGRNYSFLIHHGTTTILVHPSAAYRRGQFRGVRADVVVLGATGLGVRPERFVRNYWNEVVCATGAKLVIPVHWDDFGRPLADGLRPMSWPADRPTAAHQRLFTLGRRSSVRVAWLGLFDAVDLTLSASESSERCPLREAPVAAFTQNRRGFRNHLGYYRQKVIDR